MQDLRRIVFTNAELLSAFNAYARRMPDFLPSGKLISCLPAVSNDDGCEVRVRMIPDDADPPGETALVFRNNDVVQPLILFCIENNVLLPRAGMKTFDIENDQAVLAIHLEISPSLYFEEACLRNEDIARIKGAV